MLLVFAVLIGYSNAVYLLSKISLGVTLYDQGAYLAP